MHILAILVYLFICYLVALIGKNRKFGFWGYFFGSILFTPIVGALLVLASDSRVKEKIVNKKEVK